VKIRRRPQSAWRASDVYGSVISIFVAYGGQEPHELAVNLRTVGGLWVEHISLLEPGSHDLEGVTGTGTAAVEITPGQALSEIAEALMVYRSVLAATVRPRLHRDASGCPRTVAQLCGAIGAAADQR